MVQLASILAWGASGRPFESGRSDKKAFTAGEGFFYALKVRRLITPPLRYGIKKTAREGGQIMKNKQNK